jgi:prephenate dehydrogenase
VVLSAPVRANIELVKALPELVPAAPAALPAQGFGGDKPIVIDLGSTKTAICQAYAGLPVHFDPVGGHPMGGKERGGLENADAAIFHGVTFALTALPRTSSRARSVAEGLARLLGSHPIWMEAEAHDRWAAATSHLPYLLANALALATPAEAAALIGPGFRSTSRLAAGFTPMMLDVLLSNGENVLEAAGRFRRELEALETALRQGDEGALRESLERSAQRHAQLVQASTGSEERA